MPLYEYECARCGKRFELIQKFSDAPEAVCLACGGRAHRRLSPPALQFKGSGWYLTDYARKATPAAKSASAGEARLPDGQASSGTAAGEGKKAVTAESESK